MKSAGLAVSGALALMVLLAAQGVAGTTLTREFRYGPGLISTVQKTGVTEVVVQGGVPEFSPGRPDLARISERVEIPAGMRVDNVEVLGLETGVVADGVRVPAAVKVLPEFGPEARTVPDPDYFSRAGFQPERPVEIGYQGYDRGRTVALLSVCPVRWDAVTGRLERVTRVSVRLTLVPDAAGPLRRERIVSEWEDAASPVRRTPTADEAAVTVKGAGREPQPFRPTQIPSVLGSPVQYLIITNETMAPQFQRLADWKTRSGVPAVVRTLSFVQQQYPSGNDDADRIRQFIRDAYTRWGTKWVLLGGDTDVIPVRLAYTTYYLTEYIASDMYYSCLDGNWNADGDSLYGEGITPDAPGDNCDLYPEVYVGRAPASDLAQAQQFVDKTLQYCTTPVGDYEKNILFFAEVLFPQNWSPGMPTSLDGAQLIEEILPYVACNPTIHFGRLYENYTDPRWSPGALQEKKAYVLDSLSRGYNIAVHVGHGYRNSMSVGDDNIGNSDAAALTNGNRLMNLYAIDCTSNAVDFPCIGEAFLHAANGGAVTNVGSTRFDFPTSGRLFQREYFRMMFCDSVNAVGELQARQKLPFIGFSTYDNVNRWTEMTLLMLGDPELRIWNGTPRLLSVVAPGSFTLGDSSVTVNVSIGVTPLYKARVTVYKPGDDLRTGTTDGAGNVTLPFHPDSAGTFYLTVTGYDCRPYQQTIPIVVGVAAGLADQPPIIDDDNLGGTSGNGNGQLDAGETVDLQIPIRNNGGTTATGVNGTLSTTDSMVSVLNSAVSYGSIPPGAMTAPASYRISIPQTTPDQREIPFQLTVLDGGSYHGVEAFQLVVSAAEPRSFSHSVLDLGGNSDGRPDPGETINLFVKLRNMGTGNSPGVTAVLRSYDGLSVISDSTSAFGDIAPGQEKQGDAFVFVPSSGAAKLELRVSDAGALRWVKTLDLSYPATPFDLIAIGAGTSMSVTWSHNLESDLLGYNIWQSTAAGGPYTKMDLVPTDRTSYFLSSGLTPLTRYYFKVTAVDSSGNESSQSAYTSALTNPPYHTIFPIPTGQNTPASVAVDHIYSGYPMDIVAGADKLFLWHPDGSAPIDADGQGSTSGDFTTLGSYYAAGPSVADLDGDGVKEIVATTWTSQNAYVFNTAGQLKPGWPRATGDSWSCAAIGDLDNDGSKEICFATNNTKFYVLRANGTDWIDGDSDPATIGVFKLLTGNYNYGTPALADIDGDGYLDIIFGSSSGILYAWSRTGANLPGFPVTLGGSISDSPAITFLDGAGDPHPEIVVATSNDSLYVFSYTGVRRAGWPVWAKSGGTSKIPSPAIADMNNDGFMDIVFAGTDGLLHVFKPDGTTLAPVNGVRFSTLTSYACESSPVVADIDGDGLNDVIVGSEDATLNGISGNGSILPGFPLQLGAEVRGTPAVCDCDGDGMSEIVVADWDKNVYMWDYDRPFSPNGPPPWPQFHHDAARTGFTASPVFVAVEDPAAAAPRAIEFSAPAPNPARTSSRVFYSVPADHAGATLDVSVYDLNGRRMQTLEHGTARTGRFSTQWNMRGPDGVPVSTGVYFLRLTLGSEGRTQKLVVVR